MIWSESVFVIIIFTVIELKGENNAIIRIGNMI